MLPRHNMYSRTRSKWVSRHSDPWTYYCLLSRCLVLSKFGFIHLDTEITYFVSDYCKYNRIVLLKTFSCCRWFPRSSFLQFSSDHSWESTNRLAIATFWRTFHHDGKFSPTWWGVLALPLPLSTITSKVVVYAPAERADTLLLLLLYPFLLCGSDHPFEEENIQIKNQSPSPILKTSLAPDHWFICRFRPVTRPLWKHITKVGSFASHWPRLFRGECRAVDQN
jgi:hypothetical protein